MKTKAQLSNMKAGLLVIILITGMVVAGLLAEKKATPALVPEEGEMFGGLNG